MMVAREPPLGWFRFATDQRHQGYGSNSRIADGINLGIGDPPTCFRSFVPENPPWNPEISQASWIVSMSTFMDLVIFFAAQRGFFPTKLGIGPTSNEHFTAEKTLLSIWFLFGFPSPACCLDLGVSGTMMHHIHQFVVLRVEHRARALFSKFTINVLWPIPRGSHRSQYIRSLPTTNAWNNLRMFSPRHPWWSCG